MSFLVNYNLIFHYFGKNIFFQIWTLQATLTKITVYINTVQVILNNVQPIKMYRSSRPEIFFEKSAHERFATFTRKHLCQILFSNKVASWGLQNFIKKETLTQLFSCKFSEFFKNSCFYRTLLAAASRQTLIFCLC